MSNKETSAHSEASAMQRNEVRKEPKQKADTKTANTKHHCVDRVPIPRFTVQRTADTALPPGSIVRPRRDLDMTHQQTIAENDRRQRKHEILMKHWSTTCASEASHIVAQFALVGEAHRFQRATRGRADVERLQRAYYGISKFALGSTGDLTPERTQQFSVLVNEVAQLHLFSAKPSSEL